MEKKTWTEPEMTELRFMPNEYVSACRRNGERSFQMKCDAIGALYYDADGDSELDYSAYYSGNAYKKFSDLNTIPVNQVNYTGFYEDIDQNLSSDTYNGFDQLVLTVTSACNSMMDIVRSQLHIGLAQTYEGISDVYIWHNTDGTGVHAGTIGVDDSYFTNKNASWS